MKNQNRKLNITAKEFEITFKSLYHKSEEDLYRKDFEHFLKTGEGPPVEFQKSRDVGLLIRVEDKDNKK